MTVEGKLVVFIFRINLLCNGYLEIRTVCVIIELRTVLFLGPHVIATWRGSDAVETNARVIAELVREM